MEVGKGEFRKEGRKIYYILLHALFLLFSSVRLTTRWSFRGPVIASWRTLRVRDERVGESEGEKSVERREREESGEEREKDR